MSIAQLFPIMPPVVQMHAASTSGNILSFETHMTEVGRSNYIAATTAAYLPANYAGVADAFANLTASTVAASPSAEVATATPLPSHGMNQMIDAPFVAQELADKTILESASKQTVPPAPEPEEVAPNIPKSKTCVDTRQFGPSSRAKTLPEHIDDEADNPKYNPAVLSDKPEIQPFAQQAVGSPAPNLPLVGAALKHMISGQTIAKRGAEAAAFFELPLKPDSTGKLGIWTTQLAAQLEITQPTLVSPHVATDGLVATSHLDLARNALWLDQLAQEIIAVASRDGQIKFSLSPATLGSLDVAIGTHADGVSIQLHPSTEIAARIFAAEQPKLSEELRQSGIKLINNDLLGGQQMGSSRDDAQAQAQHPDRHIALRHSIPLTTLSTFHAMPTQPTRGRFA